ncbi:MAG: hypothetical protein Q8Q41_02160, partial [bacterium]|nr:hypothetical protein [bacterium]
MKELRTQKKGGAGKRAAEKIVWWVVKIFASLVIILPVRCLSRFGKIIGKLSFICLNKRKDIALKNLRFTIGAESKEAEIRVILKQSLQNFAISVIELLFLFSKKNNSRALRFIEENIELDGKEFLDKALLHRKGIIAFSAHLGNFPLIGPKLRSLGYSFAVLVRNPENQRLANFLSSMRDQMDIESILDKPKNLAAQKSLKCLRENGILFLQTDQHTSRNEAWVSFFGWNIPTYKGPVVLALRTKAPILPIFIVRTEGLRHKIVIHPPVSLSISDNKNNDIEKN